MAQLCVLVPDHFRAISVHAQEKDPEITRLPASNCIRLFFVWRRDERTRCAPVGRPLSTGRKSKID